MVGCSSGIFDIEAEDIYILIYREELGARGCEDPISVQVCNSMLACCIRTWRWCPIMFIITVGTRQRDTELIECFSI